MFMPLQSVWAAAADYCSHEAAPGAVHFRHHVHQHQEDGDGGKAGTSPAKTASDTDCHAYHGIANALHQDASATALWVQDMQLAPPVRFTLPTPVPSGPNALTGAPLPERQGGAGQPFPS